MRSIEARQATFLFHFFHFRGGRCCSSALVQTTLIVQTRLTPCLSKVHSLILGRGSLSVYSVYAALAKLELSACAFTAVDLIWKKRSPLRMWNTHCFRGARSPQHWKEAKANGYTTAAKAGCWDVCSCLAWPSTKCGANQQLGQAARSSRLEKLTAIRTLSCCMPLFRGNVMALLVWMHERARLQDHGGAADRFAALCTWNAVGTKEARSEHIAHRKSTLIAHGERDEAR